MTSVAAKKPDLKVLNVSSVLMLHTHSCHESMPQAYVCMRCGLWGRRQSKTTCINLVGHSLLAACLSPGSAAGRGAAVCLSVPVVLQIVVEGDPGDHFYIIKEGEAVVYQSGPGGRQHKVNHLFRSDFFGERALLVPEPRMATVRTSSLHKSWLLISDPPSMLFLEPHACSPAGPMCGVRVGSA